MNGQALAGESGRAEGVVLSLDSSIPDDQTTGRYSNDALSAIVVEPRITSFTLVNPNGVELESSPTVRRSQKLLLQVRWNYVQAEDVQVDLTRNGVAYEREALSTSSSAAQAARLPDGFGNDLLARELQGAGSTGYSTASWLFDFSDLETGTYTLRVEGGDDLDTGNAVRTIQVRVGASDAPELSVDRTSVTRGEQLRYTITGSDAGQYHAVSLSRSRLRNANVDPNRAFRRVGDVVTTGSTSAAAYAVLRVPEEGVAVGTVDTALLDTGSTRLRLHAGRSSSADAAATVSASPDGVREQRVDVVRSTATTNLGTFQYVIGSRIDVRGTADGPRYVSLYVRDEGDWELLTLNGRERTPVGSDDVWEARNVRLSEEGPGGRLLSIPGTYRLAVVDADGFAGGAPARLPTRELNQLANDRTTIRTVAPGRTYLVQLDTVGGELAEGDTLTVRGTAPGASEVAMIFVGERGGVETAVDSVSRDNTFEDRVSLDGLRRGRVTALVAAPGRDGVFGSGSARSPDGTTIRLDSASALARYAEAHRNRGLTGDQIVARIDGDVLRAVASDDLVVRRTFRIAAPRTDVRDVVPATTPNATGMRPIVVGETMLIRGTTNRNPRDTVITVEVSDGPSADAIPDITVRSWNQSGTWTARLAVPADAEPGTYTLEVNDGGNTVTSSVTVVSARDGTPTPTEVPPTATPRPTTTGTTRTTAGPTTTAEPTTTTGQSPGFGVTVALLAVALALLAGLRRRSG